MSGGGFAVIPDETSQPSALFIELEDALDWALARYGGDAFCIRFLVLTPVERAETKGSSGPA